MAEAVVEERPSVHTRFYCHMCNVEINIPAANYTCPLCSGGFVEELPDGVSAPESNNGSATSLGASSDSSVGELPVHNLNALRHDIATLLTSRNVPNLEITIEPGSRRANVVSLGGTGSGTSVAGGIVNAGSGNTVGGGRVRPGNLDRLDNVLFDFLQSLPIGGNAADFGNSHMLFMGNPGDYAWGREGLDTIVTQMLNQMETSGPPPLSKQKIEEICKVAISADDVERKLQCSVCWDDFKLDEFVRKLPCSHIYHENCIVPWLNLHGTCPICRKSLTDDESDDSIIMDDATPSSATGSQTCPGHGNTASQTIDTDSNDVNVVGSSNRIATGNIRFVPSSQQAQQGQGSSSNARNNVFTFDDDQLNLD